MAHDPLPCPEKYPPGFCFMAASLIFPRRLSQWLHFEVLPIAMQA
jgi:hypothetical protein